MKHAVDSTQTRWEDSDSDDWLMEVDKARRMDSAPPLHLPTVSVASSARSDRRFEFYQNSFKYVVPHLSRGSRQASAFLQYASRLFRQQQKTRFLTFLLTVRWLNRYWYDVLFPQSIPDLLDGRNTGLLHQEGDPTKSETTNCRHIFAESMHFVLMKPEERNISLSSRFGDANLSLHLSGFLVCT